MYSPFMSLIVFFNVTISSSFDLIIVFKSELALISEGSESSRSRINLQKKAIIMFSYIVSFLLLYQ